MSDWADDRGFSRQTVTTAHGPIGVVESGDRAGRDVVFVHGWPETSRAWADVMTAAGDRAHLVALDLPGVGTSRGAGSDGTTTDLATAIHEVVTALGLDDPVVVGHDLGGMAAYTYLRTFAPSAAAVLDVVVPGVEPWTAVHANPFIWHFRLHAIPSLPETLVTGRERAYFDWFFDTLSPDPATVTDDARAIYADAYATPAALRAGFDWYRAFDRDAEANAELADRACATTLLYLRGEHERGDITAYVDGFHEAGVADVRSATIPGAGHFAPEDAPEAVWERLATLL
jgi:pimeloyl-ACP methyl ester carboxylesterase